MKHTILKTEDNSALVEFENDSGLVYSRSINIPSESGGDVNHPSFLSILEHQKNSIAYKASIGVISFSEKV